MSHLTDDLALLIQRGGWIMLPLLLLSAVSLALIIERICFWVSTHRPGRMARLELLNDALRRNEQPIVLRMTESERTPYGEVARRLLDQGASDAVAMEAVEMQRPRFERFMVTLSTIITAAPLLGILGTVIGIIQSFNLLGQQTTLTDPRAVSAGIAEALITTAMGLLIALFTLFPYMVFRAQVGRALGRLESLIAAAQQGAEGRAGRRGAAGF